MEKLERNEILARLYALRAGLSAISQKSDEVNGVLHTRDKQVALLEGKKRTLRDKISEYEKQIDRIQSEEAYQNKDWRSIHAELTGTVGWQYSNAWQRFENDHIAYMENRLLEAERRVQRAKRKKTIHIFVHILLIAATAWCSFVYSLTLQNGYLTWAIVCGLLIVFSPMGLILGILDDKLNLINTVENCNLSCMIRLRWINYVSGMAKGDFLRIDQDGLKLARAAFEGAKAKRPVLLSQIAETKQAIAAKDGDIDTARRQAIMETNPLLVQSEVMNSALRATFSDFLDPRDWRHVDLIIFYFETGRADSFKEALQQADREMQTNRIVNAVQSAGALITQTINNGFSNLQKSMVHCFGVLSEQIAIASQQLGEISQQLSGVSMRIEGVSTQLGGMRVDFRRALEAKASVPSTQLADDLHYMRMLAENAEVRRRNGLE